jgi:hypothetical protein
MHTVGFEPTISVGERPQTHDLDRAATGTGTKIFLQFIIVECCNKVKKLNQN